MWRAMLTGLRAHKGRLARTAIAVVLGVSFVSGTYVLTDTLDDVFDDIMVTATEQADLYVRGEAAFVQVTQPDLDREPVPQELLAEVQGVPGVRRAVGSIGGMATLVDEHGEFMAAGMAPTIATSWSPLGPLQIRDGRPPQVDGEVVIDAATAERQGLTPGDEVSVALTGPSRSFTVVGIAGWGENDNLAGAAMAAFDLETAQRGFGKEGLLDSIEVELDPRVIPGQLAERIEGILPSGFEAVPAERVADESANSIQFFLGFLQTALLIFAGIGLFVGAFIIFNTFSIIVAQRTREFALLRALGASPRQVTASVLGEALLVATVASGIGLGLGVALAAGLRRLLDAFGMQLPSGGMVFLPRTAIVAVGLGVVITTLAALSPARRAARVPPLAAMRDVGADAGGSMRRRVIVGAVLGTAGLGALMVGLLGGVGNGLVLVGAGAIAVFIAVAAVSPLLARPLARVIGVPLSRLSPVAGRLARDNSMRNTKRTATTAAALTVGVALVAFVAVFSASIKASARSGLDRGLNADLVVGSVQDFGPMSVFSPEVAERLADRPEVAVASPLRFGEGRFRGATKMVVAVDPDTIERVVNLDVRAGSVRSLGADGVLLGDAVAADLGLGVGDPMTLTFARTGRQQMRVAGVFANGGPVNTDYLVSMEGFEANFGTQLDFRLYLAGAGGVAPGALRGAVEAVTAEFPGTKVMTSEELIRTVEGQIDQLMGLMSALLGLAVIIALIGIANTLGLSIVERTRELGLLRAVGMTRGQLRSMVRWEAVIIALLGALLGLAVGLFFGWATVTAMRDQGVSTLAMPGAQLLVYMALAGLAGVVAAALPARRAARLDVLEAIATE